MSVELGRACLLCVTRRKYEETRAPSLMGGNEGRVLEHDETDGPRAAPGETRRPHPSRAPYPRGKFALAGPHATPDPAKSGSDR